LIEKGKVWASQSNGCFPIQQRKLGTEQVNHILGGDKEKSEYSQGDMKKSCSVRFSKIQDEDQVILSLFTDALNQECAYVHTLYSPHGSQLFILCADPICLPTPTPNRLAHRD
jgi:hypothetical protein